MATKKPSYYLSEEMVFNILSFLPVASLLRFKAVCKTWLSIISSPQFVEAHLTSSKKKQVSVLKASYDWSVYSVDTPEESVGLKLPSHCNGMVRYIRSCNGLVCLSNEDCDVIYIWNSCTRQFKMLPATEKKAGLIPLYLGFGFDAVENDYKILKIVDGHGFDFETGELYSANADSWKDIKVPVIEESFWHGPRKICGPDIYGVLYLEGDCGLLSFDLHNEVFGENGVLCFPNHVPHNFEPYVGEKTKMLNVLDFEGYVAMIFKFDYDSVLSFWTLDDVYVSWTKKFNLETDLELNRVYLYLGFEQFVGLNYVFGYKFYDYKRKRLRSFLSQPILPMSSQLSGSLRPLFPLMGLNSRSKVDHSRGRNSPVELCQVCL